jgi:hypothetical protein
MVTELLEGAVQGLAEILGIKQFITWWDIAF